MADRAGVSAATVSRVLNGGYPVSKPIRDRVLAAVSDIDYVQNAHAQALVQARTGIVGVVLADVSDPFYSEIIRPIQRICNENGRLIVIGSTQGDAATEDSYLQTLRSQRVDAVIVLGGGSDDERIQSSIVRQSAAFARDDRKLVLCGRPTPPGASGVLAVEVDNFDAGRQATRCLVREGHRRILFVGGPAGSTTSRDRLLGFRSEAEQLGLAPSDYAVEEGDFSRRSGYDCVRRLRPLEAGFTAVFAANDLMAVGAMAALREAGVAVPRDMSVIGIDDVPLAADMVPRLSTVRLPLEEMGALAARIALGLDAEPPPVPLPVALVRGATVAPPRPGGHREPISPLHP
ncbi:LacI family DNA-binding transcriptional regulator [Labrys monachus]|uniref:LacI family transcriptional regulator n=1 Tax=Labrys monachus TaxID=217067 RepID=A0ABU0FIK1_9HYPH|nr:LacI family DNA-binding transcriptional regulator [Labrys monachus]MDQ0394432.1 LacI family transcriptional regulator [Labrys monachus]